jgi:hypothetical protein
VWEQLVQGALGGLGVILLLYSLAQWGALRRTLYAYYALLVVCSTLFSLQFFGVGEMYLWTDNAWIEAHMAGMSALLATTATSLFVVEVLGDDLRARLRTALRVPERSPRRGEASALAPGSSFPGCRSSPAAR